MFFQKKLITDNSAEQIRNITNILEENNIHYHTKTITNKTAGRRYAETQLAAHYLQNSISNISYVYVVYVKKRDFKKASELIS